MKPVELYAPQSYIQANPHDRTYRVNGCGPGGWLNRLVPDTIYGLDVSEACNIHDWMYFVGLTIEDKERADRVMLNNLIRIIDANTSFGWLRRLRYRRARTYYDAVCTFGGPFFWHGKNPPEELFIFDPVGAFA